MVVRDDPVIEKWRQFDWESLQAYLDGEIHAQDSRQSAAEEGKTRLLEESTKYRETTDKEQRKAALPLIKAFQREVDECRDRERAIGAALVHIFGQLADLPDPRASLALLPEWASAAARSATAQEEAAALKHEIASITEEFAGLKNQDVTVRQLREKIKELEKDNMSAIERLLAETEKAIQDSTVEKDETTKELMEAHAASVNSMEKQIGDLEARVRAQQRQLDGARADAGHKETVEGDEKEEREREAEMLRRKLKAAEREIAALTAELRQAKSASSPPASPIEDIAALGGLMKERDEQISKLIEENRRMAAKAAADARAAEQKMARMQNELSKQRELIIHMQAELAGKGDYEAVKLELRALREIELGPEAAAVMDDNTPQTTVGEALKKLDKYMSEKNKKLNNENVQLRKAKEELNGYGTTSSSSKPLPPPALAIVNGGGSSSSAIDETVDAVAAVAALDAIPDVLQPIMQAILMPAGSEAFSEAIAAAADAARAAAASTEDEELEATAAEDEIDEDGPRLNEPDPDAAQNLFNLLLQSMNSTTEEELLLAEPKPTKSSGGGSRNRSNHHSSIARTPYVHGIESRPLPSSSGRYDRNDPPFVPSQTATIVGKAEPTPAEQKVIKELQARVAANVRGLGQTALNTGEIASQCKRLMVGYNIGQRLFAKFVMNQSQGSLSELLSKPRPWSKLTDKGREAFRRIYGWISDTTTIELLCSLSPRRIHPGETKVEHPTPESLWESNQGTLVLDQNNRSTELIRKEDSPRKAVSAKEDQYRSAGTAMASASVAPIAHSASNGERRSTRSDVEHAATGAPPRDPHHQPAQQQQHNSSSSSGSSPTKGSSRWRHDDIPKEKITQIFENELAKLREQESHLERAINHRGPTHSSSAVSSHQSTGSSLRKLEVMAAAEHNGELPIQVNYAQQVMTLKIRAGLSPLTQEQFEAYPTLDTDELVKHIKEFLSTNSISQKQFGDYVLGLSQGSVSDLLAKPKNWAMLTQKGKEPFVRMKLFMKDVDAAIEKDKSKAARAKRPVIHIAHQLRGDHTNYDIEEPSIPLFAKVKLEPPEEEMSGGGEEMDTCALVRRVKDRLSKNGISQRDFGEQVLGLTSGSTSDVMLRTKVWSALTAPKQREPYEKMQQWLDDHLGVVKLMAKLHELKGSVTQSSAAPPPPPPQPEATSNGRTIKRPAPYDPSSFESQNGMGPPRKRTVITDQQKDALKFVFAHEQHPSLTTIEQLAEKLSMSVKTVQNWFHNHRTRAKSAALKREEDDHALASNGDWLHALEGILQQAKAAAPIDEEEEEPQPRSAMSVPIVKKEPVSPTHSSASSTTSVSAASKPRPPPGGGSSSTLDKAIERMRMLAAGGAS